MLSIEVPNSLMSGSLAGVANAPLHLFFAVLHACMAVSLSTLKMAGRIFKKKVSQKVSQMKHSYHLIHPELKTSSIRLVVSHNGKKYANGTGLVVQTALWNKKAKSLASKCKDVSVRNDLLKIESRLLEKEGQVKTEREIRGAIEYALGNKEQEQCVVSLWDYFKEWSERDMPSKRFRVLAYTRIGDIMGKEDDWSDIDGDWIFRFISECDELEYSFNYKSTLLSKFKTMMKEAYDRGIHTNEAYRLIKTGYKTADTIALTKEEVDAIWGAELSGVQARARDCFIVGVYCAGRFQDYSKLSEENIIDGKLRYVQRKTGKTVIIPCSTRIREVFARNGGGVPKVSQQEVGREMKNICRALGGSFLDVVEITKTKGKKTEIEKKLRCDMVSTHTARRSGASILYKSGVPIRVCRFLTGHSTDTMFLNYVKCSIEEGAEILAKSTFFI